METFLSKHANAVIGALCGFDRLVFRGTLRLLARRSGMMSYLWQVQVLLKDFASHAEALTRPHDSPHFYWSTSSMNTARFPTAC